MNKTISKRNKNKCPSSTTNDKRDATEKCILKEKVSEKIELKNGLVNGISNNMSVEKSHSRKSKRNKLGPPTVNGEPISHNKEVEPKNSPQENCLKEVSRQEDQSKKVDPILNNVHRNYNTAETKDKKSDCANGIVPIDLSCTVESAAEAVADVSLCQDLFLNDLELNKQEDCPIASTSRSLEESAVNTITTDNSKSAVDVDKITESVDNIRLEEEKEESALSEAKPKIDFIQYESELQMPMIMRIIQKDLSEPYSIYTYRYFIHNWPKLCFLVRIWYFLFTYRNVI